METVKLVNSEDKYFIELNSIKKTINNNLLLNIECKSNLKLIFSYLRYNYILKLIKKNKSLQKNLGIDKKNYRNFSDVKYNSIEKKKVNSGYINNYAFICQLFFYLYLFLIMVTCYTLYVNFKQKDFNIAFAKNANFSLLGLIAFSLIFPCCLKTDRFHAYFILFFIFIQLFYEIIITVKIYIIFRFSSSAPFEPCIDLFCDFCFLVINFIYIFFQLIFIIEFWPKRKRNIIHYLISFKNIRIKPYIIDNFKEFEKNEKKYILNIEEKLEHYYLYEDLKIIDKINNLRTKNKLAKLEKINKLPDFIRNEISEVILFNEQALFKLSTNKYLLKSEVGDFDNYFRNNNGRLNDILLLKDLNAINIITQGNMQYILLYEYI